MQRLDLGGVIPVPSSYHRNLHQIMWMKGHEVFEGYNDFGESVSDFVSHGERDRFNVWYAWKYILGKKLDEWELNIVKDASTLCMEKYNHPLEDLDGDELAI